MGSSRELNLYTNPATKFCVRQASGHSAYSSPCTPMSATHQGRWVCAHSQQQWDSIKYEEKLDGIPLHAPGAPSVSRAQMGDEFPSSPGINKEEQAVRAELVNIFFYYSSPWCRQGYWVYNSRIFNDVILVRITLLWGGVSWFQWVTSSVQSTSVCYT